MRRELLYEKRGRTISKDLSLRRWKRKTAQCRECFLRREPFWAYTRTPSTGRRTRNRSRELADEPGGTLPPREFARRAAEMANEFGLGVESLTAKQIRELGMG